MSLEYPWQTYWWYNNVAVLFTLVSIWALNMFCRWHPPSSTSMCTQTIASLLFNDAFHAGKTHLFHISSVQQNQWQASLCCQISEIKDQVPWVVGGGILKASCQHPCPWYIHRPRLEAGPLSELTNINIRASLLIISRYRTSGNII